MKVCTWKFCDVLWGIRVAVTSVSLDPVNNYQGSEYRNILSNQQSNHFLISLLFDLFAT